MIDIDELLTQLASQLDEENPIAAFICRQGAAYINELRNNYLKAFQEGK